MSAEANCGIIREIKRKDIEMSDSDGKKKCGCFCKLLWCLAGVVLLAFLVVASMPLWISPIATGVANSVVPKLTGTAFHVERIYVNPWTGAVRVNDMKLSNPEGFGESPAFSMKSFVLDLSLFALFSNTLHVKELIIEDPFASYYSHDGTNNIDFILANVEKVLGEKKEEKEEEAEEKDEKSQMKLVIDHLRVSGTKLKLMENDVIPPVPIMTIDLKDIGKDSDGSFDAVCQSISDAFMKGMGSVGDGLGALGGMLGDGAKSLTGALTDGTKSLSDALSGTGDTAKDTAKSAADAAKDAAKGVTGALSDGAKSITSLLGGNKDEKKAEGAAEPVKEETKDAAKGADDATKGATDTAKGAASAVGDGAKAAVDAVGDTANKATEGVKNLFKGFGK